MIKAILKTFILLLLVTACNLPTSSQSSSPDPGAVATIVELTLTAERLSVKPTQTSSVSNNSQGEQTQISIISPTPSFTITPTILPQPTNTPTETKAPSELKESLGQPDWIDSLDNGTNFGLDAAGYQDDYTKMSIQDGGMILSNSSQYGYRGWRLTFQAPQDFYLETSIHTISCSGADQYGLVIRAPNYSSGYGYYFGITCDGQYNVSKWDANGIQFILNPTQSESLNAGDNQNNLLGIHAQGSILKVYINDIFLSEITDSIFIQSGHFGIFITGQSPGEFIIKVENIQLWNLQ